MIHVVITGPPKTGFYPYRVDWWAEGRPQIIGAWPLPLYDACWKLKQMGLMDDTQVALFEGDDPHWKIQTTVGEGCRKWIEPWQEVKMGQYREYPGGPLKDIPNAEPPIWPRQSPKRSSSASASGSDRQGEMISADRQRRRPQRVICQQRAEAIEGKKLPLDDEARASLIRMADGDGRASLTLAEEVWRAARAGEVFDVAALQEVVQRRAPIYDKKQDGHYNLISALHKSVRGSDPDAALYYLARMLDAGEDPLYLARRIVRMAVEDIGLADPQALVVANAAKDAYDFLGSPEGELALAEAVIYVATAPKSNATYTAFGAAMRTAKEAGSLLPPKHILNAPTKLMKTEGYGSGYEYDHDAEEAFSGQDYFPEALGRQQFYDPPERGFEREIRKRLEYWAKLRRERIGGGNE